MVIADKVLGLPAAMLASWGYWIIVLAAIVESTPIFGLFFPGQVVVIIAGVLVKLGILKLWPSIMIASLGAIIGDYIGFYIGKKYGYGFLKKYGKHVYYTEEYVEKTRLLVNEHAGKALILGRFNSLARAFTPFIAGMANVSNLRFSVYNIIGGISWGTAFILIGFVFGESYKIASKYLGDFLIIAMLLSMFIVFAYSFVNKRQHIFERYHLYTLMINITSLYVFSKMIEDVFEGELVISLDNWISSNITLLWNPLMNKLMIFISYLGSLYVLLPLSMLLLAYFIYKKNVYNSFLLITSMAGGLMLELLMNLVMHRPGPDNSLINAIGYSFPSGHAMMSAVLFAIMLYAFRRKIKNKDYKNIFTFAIIGLIAIIGFSRIYLNAHWFSDVVGGVALGLFWLTLVILIFQAIILFAGYSWSKIKG